MQSMNANITFLLVDVLTLYDINSAEISFSSIMGFLKGKIAIRLFRQYERFGKRHKGRYLWGLRYCESTVELNDKQIREYVKYQEK